MDFVIMPGVLIVILSYASFWMDYNMVPARTTLCIITVLAAVNQLNEGYSSIPRISYQTWLLTFLYTNLVFTIVSMIEFIIIYSLKI